MPKSSRDAGRTPWSTSLTPGSEAVCLEHTGFPSAEEGDTAGILTVEGTLSGAIESKYKGIAVISSKAIFCGFNLDGKYFSQVEIGKNWLIAELSETAPTNLFDGWETSVRRKELELNKVSKKNTRTPEAHVTDAIALCSLILEDWKRLGQFVVKKVRLLERNSGLLLKRKEVKRGEFLPRLKPWVSFA